MAIVIVPLLEDELLASYWARLRQVNFHATGRDINRHVLRAASRQVSPDLPTHLQIFFDNVGRYLVSDVAELVTRHTQFPIHAAGLTDERRRSLLRRMSRACNGPRVSLSSMPAALLSISAKSCPACDEESRLLYGVTYHHRIHHAFGLSTCARHGVMLKVSVPAEPRGHHLGGLTIRPGTLENELLLSGSYHKFYDDQRPGGRTIREDLLARASHAAGATRPSELGRRAAMLIRDRFGSGLTSSTYQELLTSDEWLEARIVIFLRSRASAHPFVTALLDASLPPLPPTQAEKRPIPHEGKASSLADLLRGNTSLSAASIVSGVSITTLSVLARSENMKFSFRPSKISDRLRQDVVAEFSTGDSIEKIATAHKIAIGSVYRILRSAPSVRKHREVAALHAKVMQARNGWVEHSQSFPSASASELRRRAPARWAWLYRNDNEWLLQRTRLRTVPRAKAERPSRTLLVADRMRLTMLLEAVRDGLLGDPAAARVSPSALLRAAGLGTSKSAAIMNVAALVAERREDYVRRRLAYAQRIARSSGKGVFPTSLLKLARLRNSTVANAGIQIDDWL